MGSEVVVDIDPFAVERWSLAILAHVFNIPCILFKNDAECE